MYSDWRGSLRGEYNAGTRQWDFFCPVWHGGQAIKALVSAYRLFSDEALLDAAKMIAEFIGRYRIQDGTDEDYGLILAYEDRGDIVNTSAIIESLDGLLELAEAGNRTDCREWALSALAWVAEKAYICNKGLFKDSYDAKKKLWVPPPWKDNSQLAGRPLIDDGLFLKGYHCSGKPKFRDIFYRTANRLLEEENPPGNWIRFAPCNSAKGNIHPRHAYWWGRPMLMAFKDSGEAEYLECAIRSGEWYVKAQRADGGMFRGVYADFRTDSFGHATSGAACAAILWREAL